MRKKIALHNLGCKVNAYELDQIAERLTAEGFDVVPLTEEADVYVVNTCTVTRIADRKSRQMLHRAKKNHPDALVIAIGCYVDTDAAGIEKDALIDPALSNREKGNLAEVLQAYFAKKEKDAGEDTASQTARTACGAGTMSCSNRTRAYIKIQDGCNLGCAYCIIPKARGQSRSRDAKEILSEAKRLAERGVKEIVLTGIHISSYGLDVPQAMRLGTLVQKINEVDGIARIRLGSLEPKMVTKEFVAQMKGADKLCAHFHLSLQSGSDAVLRRMRRRYQTADFRESVERLRDAFDTPAITTDIITGFPAETEAEFEETLAFAEEIDFYEMHVFPFSARKGTDASRMEGQLTQAEKAARSRRLLALSKEQAKRYRSRFLSKPATVLWEETVGIKGKRLDTGLTERYVRIAKEQTKETRGTLSVVTPDRFLTDEVLFADGDGS